MLPPVGACEGAAPFTRQSGVSKPPRPPLAAAGSSANLESKLAPFWFVCLLVSTTLVVWLVVTMVSTTLLEGFVVTMVPPWPPSVVPTTMVEGRVVAGTLVLVPTALVLWTTVPLALEEFTTVSMGLGLVAVAPTMAVSSLPATVVRRGFISPCWRSLMPAAPRAGPVSLLAGASTHGQGRCSLHWLQMFHIFHLYGTRVSLNSGVEYELSLFLGPVKT